MNSPTQLTLARLRKQGWTCAVVEKWNHHIKCRQDLFGGIDILAVKGPRTLGVQACSIGDISTRLNKLRGILALEKWVQGRELEVWGWVKKNGLWQVKIVALTGDQMAPVERCNPPRRGRKNVQPELFS